MHESVSFRNLLTVPFMSNTKSCACVCSESIQFRPWSWTSQVWLRSCARIS